MANRKRSRKNSANNAKKRSSKPARVTQNMIEKHKSDIPARLAKIRADRSQRSFARELGVFQQNVNRYENGTVPHPNFLITLALRENVSLDWLLLGRGKPRRF